MFLGLSAVVLLLSALGSSGKDVCPVGDDLFNLWVCGNEIIKRVDSSSGFAFLGELRFRDEAIMQEREEFGDDLIDGLFPNAEQQR